MTLAEIEGPGAIQHIWMTVHPDHWRQLVLRIYWDGEETPVGRDAAAATSSATAGASAATSPRCRSRSIRPAASTSYWEMPFRKSARITLENLSRRRTSRLYYQIDYTLTDVPDDCAYFHAQWRRSNPLPYKEVHTLLDGVTGQGQYVGHLPGLGRQQQRLVGRGRDQVLPGRRQEFPTICGTGTEDYFGGAWNFEHPQGSTASSPRRSSACPR